MEAREPEQAVLTGNIIHHRQALQTAGMMRSCHMPPRLHLVTAVLMLSPNRLFFLHAALCGRTGMLSVG